MVPLTDDIALWPQLGLGVTQSRFETEGLGRTLSRGIGAELEVSLLVPLGRHVVVRLAPTLAYNHASNEGAALSGVSGDGETIAAGYARRWACRSERQDFERLPSGQRGARFLDFLRRVGRPLVEPARRGRHGRFAFDGSEWTTISRPSSGTLSRAR